jgi:hypothetical protein
MSEDSESNAVLGFVLGAIVVAAGAFIFFVVRGPEGSIGASAAPDVNVTIEAPPAPARPNPS